MAFFLSLSLKTEALFFVLLSIAYKIMKTACTNPPLVVQCLDRAMLH